MLFKNREDAAAKLSDRLIHLLGKNPLVLGIPRGAVPMAKIIAERLQGEVGVVLVRKIPAPWNEELAIGSVGLSGKIHAMPFAKRYGINEIDLREASRKQLELLKKRQNKYRISDPDYRGRIVIVVDDGIATGATTQSAIEEIRDLGAKKIILAAAVCPPDTLIELRRLVDEIVVLESPTFFVSVSQFFEDFPQVSDEEVVDALHPDAKALTRNQVRNSPSIFPQQSS